MGVCYAGLQPNASATDGKESGRLDDEFENVGGSSDVHNASTEQR